MKHEDFPRLLHKRRLWSTCCNSLQKEIPAHPYTIWPCACLVCLCVCVFVCMCFLCLCLCANARVKNSQPSKSAHLYVDVELFEIDSSDGMISDASTKDSSSSEEDEPSSDDDDEGSDDDWWPTWPNPLMIQHQVNGNGECRECFS